MRDGRRIALTLGLIGLAVVVTVVAPLWWNSSRVRERVAELGKTGAEAPRSPESEPASGLEAAPASEAEAEVPTRTRPDGVWIRGRVILPAGTPADEHVELAARVLSFDDAPGYVTGIDGEGRFEVMFPKDVDAGWIELRGRYLMLRPNASVDLEAPPDEIVIRPELGGRIVGRIVAPDGSRDLEGTEVELSTVKNPEAQPAPRRRLLVGKDLTFELNGLPSAPTYQLVAKAHGLLPSVQTITIPAGTTTEIDARLRAGVSLSGRVLDPDGGPVDGAELRGDPTTISKSRVRMWTPSSSSRSDGTFRLSAIEPGDIELEIRAARFLPQVLNLGSLGEGDEKTGIDVQLRHAIVRGQIRWPDGRPVENAVVFLTEPSESGRFSPVKVETYGEGRFETRAETEGPFRLDARSPMEPSLDPDELSATIECGTGELGDIRPGPEPVELVLNPTPIVRGLVIDDLGQPVTECKITAQAKPKSGNLWNPLHFVSVEGSHPDGAFAFGGLPPGAWLFRASLNHEESPWVSLDIPSRVEPIVLTLPRARGKVSGIVVDPEDRPVSGAQVSANRGASTTSKSDGTFELKNLPSGTLDVTASARPFVPSAVARFRVASGAEVSEVRLALRRGGSISCQVLDGNGRPEHGRSVDCVRIQKRQLGRFGQRPQSDEDGRLLIEDLETGAYLLSKIQGVRGSSSSERLQESKSQALVEVIEGEVAEVVLGGPRGSPIRVRGRLTDDRGSLPGVEWHDRGAVPSTAVLERTDGDGRFELSVPEAGPVEFTFLPDNRTTRLQAWRTVGESPSVDLEFNLPRGRIGGAVRSSAGRAIAGALVTLIHVDGDLLPPQAWSAYGSTRTDDEGGFAFMHVPPGSFELFAYPDPDRVAEGARASQRLTVEEGAAVEDLVIRLP